MSAQTHNGLDKKWISFGILMLGAGTIYKLGFLKDAFYVPMQEFMGLSHTQIGTAMSIAGLISTFGFLASIYLTDRISKKNHDSPGPDWHLSLRFMVIDLPVVSHLPAHLLSPRSLCRHALLADHAQDGPPLG